MYLTLNNRPESFEHETLTIAEILLLKNFTFKMMVVKINGKLIKKDQYAEAIVTEGDNVEIIHLISGG